MAGLLPIAFYYSDIVQATLAAVSIVLAVVSVNAFRRRSEGRYLLLSLAFVSLCVASVGTTLLEFLVGLGPTTVQFVELYLNPSLELLMVVSFLVAVLWSSKAKRRIVLAFVATVIAIGLTTSAFYVVTSPGAGGGAQALLPAGCSRPIGGFLIIASSMGYNDSVAHGAPVKNWPIIDVTKGTDVSITVCNTYSQVVGFQVTHYLESSIEAIPPGQVLRVSFLANETGTFAVYCAVFSPLHIYLQGGELNVL